MKKLLKYLSVILLSLVGVILLLFAFISPITKYVINKNCVQWTGRRISMGSISVNPLTGSLTVKNIKIYELKGDSSFIDCKKIALKINMNKLLNKFYEIDQLEIDEPQIHIFQKGLNFSFDDLTKRFSSNDTGHKDTTRLHYDLNNMSINNGSIIYNNVLIHNSYTLSNLSIQLPEIRSDKPESKLHLAFNSGEKGSFTIDIDANLETLKYDMYVAINNYDLSQYYAPLKTYMKISSLKGTLNTKLRMHGKFNNPEDFSLACTLDIKDIEIRDMRKKRLFALGELYTTVDTLSVKQNLFDFSRILLDKPYVAFETFPGGSNISRAFIHHPVKETKDTVTGKTKRDYSNVFALLVSSIEGSAINFLGTNYQSDDMDIRNGEFVFDDLTPHHHFHCKVSHINVSTDELETKTRRVFFRASALLNDTGKFSVKADIAYNFKKKLFSYNISKFNIPDISPIAKYMLEKNSVKWTGRYITTGGIKVDPLNGSIAVKNIKVYEPDSTDLFFGCSNIYVQMNLKEMTNNMYQVNKIQIDNPEINIIQNGNNFNFDDMVKHFSPDTTSHTDTTKAPGLHYDIKNIAISNGTVTYNNLPIHNIVKIHELNASTPELSWDNPTSNLHLDCNYGTGGRLNLDMDINRTTLEYNITLNVDNYDLSQYYAPLNSFLKISSLKGLLSTQLQLHGEFNHPQYFSGAGYIHINNLEIKDTTQQKVFALGELALNFDTVNVEHGIYYLNNILLDKPFLRFDYLPKGNNISQMIKYTAPAAPVQDTTTGQPKPDYSNIFTLLSSSVKLMAINFSSTNYHTDSIIIHNGQFLYNDYTLNIPFHYNISDINITTNKISSKTKNIEFNLLATLADTGTLKMDAHISPDLKNMLINYDISNLRLTDLNPYTEYYVGTTFLDGYMDYKSTDSVINRFLKSSNNIHLEGVETSQEIEGRPVYNLPVRMAIALLKDAHGNIDVNMPASGDLDDPDYKIGKLAGRTLRELITKTASSPFKSLGKLINRNPEDMKHFHFEYLQDNLTKDQLGKLDDVYKVLKKKKELDVEITQVIDSVEEKDELALFLAKDEYYDYTKHPLEDSLLTRRQLKQQKHYEEKMVIQDSLFDQFLNKKLHLAGNELISVEDKCIMLIGDSLLTTEVHDLMEKRNEAVTEFLVHKKSLNPKRVKVIMNTDPIKTLHTPEPEFDIKYSAGQN